MDDMEKKLKRLEDQVKTEQASKEKKAPKPVDSERTAKKSGHPVTELLVGLVLIGGGVFWILNSFAVTFTWGSLWSGWGIHVGMVTGLMLVPLLVGIGLLFFLDRKWIGWTVTAIGVLAILITLLTSVRFHPLSATLWQYVLMFGMVAAGAGLALRALWKHDRS